MGWTSLSGLIENCRLSDKSLDVAEPYKQSSRRGQQEGSRRGTSYWEWKVRNQLQSFS